MNKSLELVRIRHAISVKSFEQSKLTENTLKRSQNVAQTVSVKNDLKSNLSKSFDIPVPKKDTYAPNAIRSVSGSLRSVQYMPKLQPKTFANTLTEMQTLMSLLVVKQNQKKVMDKDQKTRQKIFGQSEKEFKRLIRELEDQFDDQKVNYLKF